MFVRLPFQNTMRVCRVFVVMHTTNQKCGPRLNLFTRPLFFFKKKCLRGSNLFSPSLLQKKGEFMWPESHTPVTTQKSDSEDLSLTASFVRSQAIWRREGGCLWFR